MEKAGPVKTRQISWDDSINWGRSRTEAEALWTDSRKQKILLVKYTKRERNEFSPNSKKASLKLSPQVKELKLVGRENSSSGSRDSSSSDLDNVSTSQSVSLLPTISSKPASATDSLQDLVAIGMPMLEEDTETCLYCNTRSSLGTDHNSWCRKLLGLNKLYTQYNLTLQSRWKTPKGFPSRKQTRLKSVRKRSAKKDDMIDEAVPIASPISHPSPTRHLVYKAVSPILWEMDKKRKSGGREKDKGSKTTEKEKTTQKSNGHRCTKTERIPRSTPLPLQVASNLPPDSLQLCVFCQSDADLNTDVSKTVGRERSATGVGAREICVSDMEPPKTPTDMTYIHDSGKYFDSPAFKDVRDQPHTCRRVVPSPVAAPPPPTPVIGAGGLTLEEIPEVSCCPAAPNLTQSKAMLYKQTNIPDSYKPLPWNMQTVEIPSNSYTMFMPHPPLRHKDVQRSPSPAPEFVLEKLGLKFKMPHVNKSVQKTKPKRTSETKPFLGKPSRFLPPIKNQSGSRCP